MTRAVPPLRTFASGEIDPLLSQRVDYQRFQTGLAKCNGYLPLVQGGITRAPGTIYRGATRAGAQGILMPFIFAADDACDLEFTDLKMRVWRYGALVMVGASPYELTTPYTLADLPNLRWQQTADVVYLVDGAHPVKKLSRLALDNWTLTDAAFDTGPFRPENTSAITVQASAATGSVTLTASAPLFVSAYVGSLFWLTPTNLTAVPLWIGNEVAAVNDLRRYDDKIYKLTLRTPANVGPTPPQHTKGKVAVQAGVEWDYVSDLDGVLRITAFTSTTQVTATVLRQVPSDAVSAATTRFAFGAWSAVYGYPTAIQLYDHRLVLAATTIEPRTLWFSTANEYENFFPGIEADESFVFTISGDGSINKVINLKSGQAGLHILALGQEFSTRSESRNQVIGPTNAVFGLDSAVGSAAAAAIVPYGNPIFISRDKSRIVQTSYDANSGSNQIAILTRPSQHLGAVLFEEIEWIASPQPMAWIRRASGDLAIMVYDPAEDVLGWATHSIAGGAVISLSVTPDPTTGTDVVRAIVRRDMGGSPSYMVEEFSPWYGLLTGAMTGAEAQHLFAALTFEPGTPTTIFTLPHMPSQEVYAWTERGEYGPMTTSGGGVVTLPEAVERATIGLFDPTHVFDTLDLQTPAADGAPQGRIRRLAHQQAIAIFKTVQGEVRSVWRTDDEPEQVSPAEPLVRTDVGANPTDLTTALARVALNTPGATEIFLRFTPTGPAPMTVLAVYPKVQQEGA